MASFLLPKTYRATVSLLVDAKNEQSLSNVLPLILPQEKLSYLQTQMDIITSKRVARKVVQDLKLAENPSTRADFEKAAGGYGSIEDWLVESLLSKLKVETSQSSMIQVTFSSADPRHSAGIANAFAKAYIDTMLELRVEPTRQAAVWYDEQLKSLRANLEDAQAKLTSYLQREGIVSTDERLDVDSTRLGALSEQVVKAQEQTFQWNAREQQAREFLKRGGSLGRSKAAGTGHAVRQQLSAISASTLGKPEPAAETRRRNEESRGGNRELCAPESPARSGSHESDGGAARATARAQGHSK